MGTPTANRPSSKRIVPSAEHFPNAPITEAVLDIAADLPASVSHDKLSAVQASIASAYPIKEVRQSWEGAFQVEAGKGAKVVQSSEAPAGFLFRSTDGRQIFQARTDGFSFHRLRPYEDWKTFSSDANRMWKLYAAVAKPERIKRVALRYINRIEIPLPADTKDYLRTGPEIAPELPQEMRTFFFRVVIPDRKRQAMVVLTEATPDEPMKATMPVILDIDVFRLGAFRTDPGKLWAIFEELHDLKNEVFFNSITERAKELFR